MESVRLKQGDIFQDDYKNELVLWEISEKLYCFYKSRTLKWFSNLTKLNKETLKSLSKVKPTQSLGIDIRNWPRETILPIIKFYVDNDAVSPSLLAKASQEKLNQKIIEAFLLEKNLFFLKRKESSIANDKKVLTIYLTDNNKYKVKIASKTSLKNNNSFLREAKLKHRKFYCFHKISGCQCASAEAARFEEADLYKIYGFKNTNLKFFINLFHYRGEKQQVEFNRYYYIANLEAIEEKMDPTLAKVLLNHKEVSLSISQLMVKWKKDKIFFRPLKDKLQNIGIDVLNDVAIDDKVKGFLLSMANKEPIVIEGRKYKIIMSYTLKGKDERKLVAKFEAVK